MKRKAQEELATIHSNAVALEIAPFSTCHCGDALKAIAAAVPGEVRE
jgi:hypothetical protein